MLQPGRSFSSNFYRWGFGSHEKDDEWRGITGADYDFGGYGYDALTGRRKSPDPLAAKYPGISPYAAFADNPIFFADENGEIIDPTPLKKSQSVAKPLLKTYTALRQKELFNTVAAYAHGRQEYVFKVEEIDPLESALYGRYGSSNFITMSEGIMRFSAVGAGEEKIVAEEFYHTAHAPKE